MINDKVEGDDHVCEGPFAHFCTASDLTAWGGDCPYCGGVGDMRILTVNEFVGGTTRPSCGFADKRHYLLRTYVDTSDRQAALDRLAKLEDYANLQQSMAFE
jgi:hypothetical protein